MKKTISLLGVTALLLTVVTSAHCYNGVDYAAAARLHLLEYGLSSSYLAGVDSALNSAYSFLQQDLAQQSRAYSSYSYSPSSYSYSPYQYGTYSYAPARYSPYTYVVPYYYFSW